MKKGYSLILFLLMTGTLLAQQEALYSQYMFNMMAVNPAYAGSREVLSVTGLTRAQWIGLEGAPLSNTLTLDAPVKQKHIGLGVLVFTDKIGVMSSSGLNASYAYRIQLNKSTLALGLRGGLVHYTANYSQVQLARTPTVTDKSFQENASVLMPSLGAGLYLSDDKYYIGASIPGMISSQLSSGSTMKVNRDQHLFLMMGYVFNLNNDFKLKPSTLLKAVKGAPLELDVNLNLWMYNKIALGVSYRTNDAAVAMLELQATPNLRIGYAYDYSITALRYFHSGSHELMLRYEFGFTQDKILTPRYF